MQSVNVDLVALIIGGRWFGCVLIIKFSQASLSAWVLDIMAAVSGLMLLLEFIGVCGSL